MSSFTSMAQPTPAFVPWQLGGRPAFVPLNANDPGIDPRIEAPMMAAEESLAAVREEAYNQGFAAARVTMDAELAAERTAVTQLATSLAALSPEPAGPLALILVETVDRLVRQVVGEVEIEPTLLLKRARAAAEIVTGEVKPSAVRLHPDDCARLARAKLPVVMIADATVPLGGIVVETAAGWVEDGVAQRLDVLRQALVNIG